MKGVVIGALVLLATALPASAEKWAAQVAGEILAYANLCDAVDVDYVAMEHWARARGVGLEQLKTRTGPDFDAVMFGSEIARNKLSGMSTANVCAEAIRLYGPEGVNVPDMLGQK